MLIEFSDRGIIVSRTISGSEEKATHRVRAWRSHEELGTGPSGAWSCELISKGVPRC